MRLWATTLRIVRSVIVRSKKAGSGLKISAVAARIPFSWRSFVLGSVDDARSLYGPSCQFAIVEGVRRKGIDVLTALGDGSDRRSDEEILTGANELGRVIFTQDVDFIVPADEWLGAGRPFAGIVFAHQHGVTIGQAIRDLEIVCRVLTPTDVASQLIRLPL